MRMENETAVELEPCYTVTVNGEPWYSDGCIILKGKTGYIMLKGKTDKRPDRAHVKMDKLFARATKNLHPVEGWFDDRTSFAQPVKRTVYDRQVVQTKYVDMISVRGWKHYVGGQLDHTPYTGEKYIVAKCGGEVVAIVAPMRKE